LIQLIQEKYKFDLTSMPIPFQVFEDEIAWGGFLIDKDSESCVNLLPGAELCESHYDPDIVAEAWDKRRTIVTCNRRHFVSEIRKFQRRENQKECRDLWGLLLVDNLRILREKKLKRLRAGLSVVAKNEPLRWPGIGFLNLYVRLTAEGKLQIRRFQRCSCCERELRPNAIWDEWYRKLPLLGNRGSGGEE
jgi:hypothetical protein